MIKLNWNYLFYFIILVLFAILHKMYYLYIFTCKEYFTQGTCSADNCDCRVPHYDLEQNTNKRNTCIALQNSVSSLFDLRAIVDMSTVTRTQALGIQAPSAGAASDEEVPGNLVAPFELDLDTSEVDEDNPTQNKKCSYKRWTKLEIDDVDRDVLIATIPALEKKLNFEFQKLTVQKIQLLQLIDDNIAILRDGLTDQFQGKCDTQCTAIKNSGCDVFCTNDKDMTLEEETFRNKAHVDKKINELEHSLCDYIKQYYYVVDLTQGQREYTEQLKNIYTDSTVTEATQKRGFTTVYPAEPYSAPA
jgi:hypothetical protein